MTVDSSRVVSANYIGTAAIAAAMVVTIPVYVAVAWHIAGSTGEAVIEPDELMPFMTTLPAIAAIFELVAAEVAMRLMVRSAARRETAAERLAGYRISVIISNSLREAAAITGLVATLLTADMRWSIGFGAAALLAMLIGWPRRRAMEHLARDPETQPIG